MEHIKLIKIPNSNKQTIENFLQTVQKGIDGKFYWSDTKLNKDLKEGDIVLFFHPKEDKLLITRVKRMFDASQDEEAKNFYENKLKNIWKDTEGKWTKYWEMEKIKEETLSNFFNEEEIKKLFPGQNVSRKNFPEELKDLKRKVEEIIKDLLKETTEYPHFPIQKEILKILKFQKQVILQGPPGTGKTFLAKKIAKQVVSEFPCKSIIELLEKYWSEFADFLDGKTFKTFGKQTEFSLKKRPQARDKLAIYINGRDINLSIYKEKIQKILEQTNCNPKGYTSDRTDTDYPYNRVIADEFINWIKKEKMKEEIKDKIKLVQFHSSYTYEDFVRGIQIEIENGYPKYKAVNKIFAQLCEEADKNPQINYVLIIDEINRANLSAVLGELIYALEYRNEEVETPYKVEGRSTLKVPSNLYIIGTMNTADRSIGHIDYAIRRRFAFIPVLADKNLISHSGARKLYEKLIEELFNSQYIAPDFKESIEDIKVGHTYFMANQEGSLSEEEQIALKVVYQVIPLLREYEKDGIILEGKVNEILEKVFGKSNPTAKDVENFLIRNKK